MGAHDNRLKDMSTRILILKLDAMQLITRTTDTLERAALERVQQPLTEALVALNPDTHRDLVCPVCGLFCGNDLTKLTTCTWCGGVFCTSECEQAYHEVPGQCPHAPQPERPQYDGPPDEDITWGKR
jgi:hypothetical protein